MTCPRPPGELKKVPGLEEAHDDDGAGHVPEIGYALKFRFCVTLSIGMSKLGVFVRLKTSKVYFNENRSVSCVTFKTDMSARRCQDWRKMFLGPM